MRPLTDVCNIQGETFMDLDDQPICIVQPLKVIVTEHPQTAVTFNEEQITIHSNVPESESESDYLSNIPMNYNIIQLLLYILCTL